MNVARSYLIGELQVTSSKYDMGFVASKVVGDNLLRY